MNNDSWNDSESDVKFKQQQPLFRPRTRSMTPNRILTQQLQLSMAINDSRNKRTQNCSLVILLIVNLLERFAYYGLICNYVLYLNKQPLFWESYNASTILLIFLGITYVSSLIGGWVADSLMGKFYTIILSYFIYIIGYAAFPLIAYNKNSIPNYCNSNRSIVDWIIINDEYNQTHLTKIKDFDRSIADESCSWIIILTVILIGVAVGFIKANLGPFGADQVMSRGQTMIFKYFNWLYWCINLGSLISFSFLAYFQQNYSFFIGFTIPFCVLVLSFVLFLCGSGCYVKQAAEVSILSNIFRVLIEAFRSAKRRKNLIRQQQRERALLSESDDNETDEYGSESVSNPDSYNNTNDLNITKMNWFDNAKIRYGGKFDDDLVEDVKSLKKILILFAILIPYWMIYLQIETSYVIQGLHMQLFTDSKINPSLNFMVPVGWLSIADQVTVLIMIPFLDGLIYPYLRKNWKNFYSENTRLMVGMTFSAASVITAGFLETYRINLIHDNPKDNIVIQVIDNTTYEAAKLFVEWQIPQYTLVGLGEVFCSVSCIYYAYSAAPKSMQSIIMGLFYFFTGIGSFIGSIIFNSFKTIIYSSQDNDDINCADCHLNYYFFLMGLLQIIGMILFLIIDLKYSIVKTKNDDSNNNDDNNNNNQTQVNSDSIIEPIINRNANLLSATISNYGTNSAVETLN